MVDDELATSLFLLMILRYLTEPTACWHKFKLSFIHIAVVGVVLLCGVDFLVVLCCSVFMKCYCCGDPLRLWLLFSLLWYCSTEYKIGS